MVTNLLPPASAAAAAPSPAVSLLAGVLQCVQKMGPTNTAATTMTLPGPQFGADLFRDLGDGFAADLLTGLGPMFVGALMRSAGARGAGGFLRGMGPQCTPGARWEGSAHIL